MKFDKQFLEWFIGFSEGDGSFIVSKDRCFFILTQKDPKVLFKIKKALGFGGVSKSGLYYRYIVAKASNIETLINIFNGNLSLKKVHERFSFWLKYYPHIRLFSINSDVSLKSGWLSGFIDAEGCFNIYKRIDRMNDMRFRFIIDQKGEEEVLKKISSLFEIDTLKNNVFLRVELENMFRLSIESKDMHLKLFNYLDKNPLRTSKKFDFLKFKKLRLKNIKK